MKFTNQICLTRKGNTTSIEAPFLGSGCGRVVQGAGCKAKRMVLQCINGVRSNSVEGRTKIWQLKNLILTLFGLIFRRIYIYNCLFIFDIRLLTTPLVSSSNSSQNVNQVKEHNKNGRTKQQLHQISLIVANQKTYKEKLQTNNLARFGFTLACNLE